MSRSSLHTLFPLEGAKPTNSSPTVPSPAAHSQSASTPAPRCTVLTLPLLAWSFLPPRVCYCSLWWRCSFHSTVLSTRPLFVPPAVSFWTVFCCMNRSEPLCFPCIVPGLCINPLLNAHMKQSFMNDCFYLLKSILSYYYRLFMHEEKQYAI